MKKLALLTLLYCLQNYVLSQPVVSFQPNIHWGGRSVALAVHPVDNNEMIAASATGGLFKTTDGGGHWHHIDNLPVFAMMDVKYNPIFSNNVIATCLVDTDTTHKIGIWLSNDRGESWRQIDALMPTIGASDMSRFNKRLNAYGISFDMNGVAYVGTDYGIAMGKAAHAVWQHFIYDRSMPISADKLQNAAYSVKAFGSGKLIIGTRNGVYYCNDMYLAHPFRRSSTAITFNDQVTYGIAQSPYNDKDVIIAPNETQLWYSGDTSLNFIPKTVPTFDRESRNPIVAIVKDPAHQGNVFVYAHHVKLFRTSCFKDNLNVFDRDWVQMNVEHDDIDGYAAVGDELKYVTTDGGVFKKVSDDRWSCIGNGTNGYSALQIYQVWGQKTESISTPAGITPSIVGGTLTTGPQIDYYFGTQDNDIWSSADHGRNWPYNGGVEGGGFEGPRTVGSAELFRTWSFAFLDNSLGINKVSGRTYSPLNRQRDPGVPSGNPKYAGFGKYFEIFTDTLTGNKKVMYTSNFGGRWDTIGLIRGYNLWQGEKASQDSSFVMYIPYSRPLPPILNIGNIGLLKLTYLIDPHGAVYYTMEAMDTVRSLGSLMIYGTDFAWPTVYGFDQNNGFRLLAPDAKDKVMKWSNDGGRTWRADDILTRLITENGRYLFAESAINFLVWTVSFNPNNSREILIGTKDAGLIYTNNGGGTWCRVPGSKQIPNITSIWWDFDGTSIISSFGRGLWRFNPAMFTALNAECVSELSPPIRITDLRKQLNLPAVLNNSQVIIHPAEIRPVTISAMMINGNNASASIVSGTSYNGESVLGRNGSCMINGFGFVPGVAASIELNGKVLVKYVPVDNEGKIYYPVTFNLGVGVYQMKVVQIGKQGRVEAPLMVKKPMHD